MDFLKPDSHTKYLNYYHKSSKLLIPLTLSSVFCHYKDYSITPMVDSICAINMGYHSYVSMSCIIHDYIKPSFWNNSARLCNVNAHLIAIGGYIYASNLYKNFD